MEARNCKSLWSGLASVPLSLTLAGAALAADAPLSNEEVSSLVVGKTMGMMLVGDTKTYEMQLLDGGKATVSGGYNDVGTWRFAGDSGRYCINWNKQAMAESCARFVRRDGTLVIVRDDGTLRGTNLVIM